MHIEIKCNTKQDVTYCYVQVTPYCGAIWTFQVWRTSKWSCTQRWKI